MKKILSKIRPSNNRVYILPTSFGTYFLSIIFCLFLISLSYGHSLSLTATFIFVSFIMSSAFTTNFNLAGINILKISNINNTFEEDDLMLEVLVENTSQKDYFGIECELYNQRFESDNIDILSGQISKIHIKVKDLERGSFNIDKIKLTSSFPFGLFKAWKILKSNDEFYIYPKKKTFYPLPKSNLDGEINEGEYGSVLSGSDDFDGHKRYSSNESWRNVDWKAYSRNRVLIVKQFKDNHSGNIILNYQLLKKLNNNDKLSQLAFWAEECFSKNYTFGILLPAASVVFGKGVTHLRTELKKLSIFDIEDIRE